VNSSLGLLIKELPDMVLPTDGLVMPVDSLLASEMASELLARSWSREICFS